MNKKIVILILFFLIALFFFLIRVFDIHLGFFVTYSLITFAFFLLILYSGTLSKNKKLDEEQKQLEYTDSHKKNKIKLSIVLNVLFVLFLLVPFISSFFVILRRPFLIVWFVLFSILIFFRAGLFSSLVSPEKEVDKKQIFTFIGNKKLAYFILFLLISGSIYDIKKQETNILPQSIAIGFFILQCLVFIFYEKKLSNSKHRIKINVFILLLNIAVFVFLLLLKNKVN